MLYKIGGLGIFGVNVEKCNVTDTLLAQHPRGLPTESNKLLPPRRFLQCFSTVRMHLGSFQVCYYSLRSVIIHHISSERKETALHETYAFVITPTNMIAKSQRYSCVSKYYQKYFTKKCLNATKYFAYFLNRVLRGFTKVTESQLISWYKSEIKRVRL